MSTIKNSKQQIGYLNALRLVAAFLVVLTHTSLAYYVTNEVTGADSFFARLYHYTGEVAVPIFMMISGSLFLRPDKEVTYGMLFRKYVRRIVLALIVFGLPMCLAEAYMSEGEGWWTAALLNFVTGHSWDHMWYLYMLVFLYLLTPVLRPFLYHSSEKTVRIGLTVLFILSIVLPTIQSYGIDLYMMTLTPFPFYYLLGAYCAHFRTTRTVWIPSMMLLTFFLYLLLRIHYGFLCPMHDDLFMCIGTVGAFLLFKNTDVRWALADRLAPYALAIYILHPIFINIVYKALHFHPNTLLPLWASIPLLTILFFLLALLAGWLLRLLPPFRKYIL